MADTVEDPVPTASPSTPTPSAAPALSSAAPAPLTELRHRATQNAPVSQPSPVLNDTIEVRSHTTTTQNGFRARAVAGAMGFGIVTAAVGGTYFLSDNETVLPLAIAACVATFSSVLIRFALGSLNGVPHHRARVRHYRHHRHFTGERAAYVRTSQRLAMMDRDFTAADYEMLLDLDNNSQRLRRFLEGASQETIAQLPTVIFRSSGDEAQPDLQRAHSESRLDDNRTMTTVDTTILRRDHDVEQIEEDIILKEKSSASAGKDNLQVAKRAFNQSTAPQNPELVRDTVKTCTICLEDFEDGMKLRILPCFHRFMADCIDPWLMQQARCPVCKFDLQEGMNALPPGCT